MNGYCKTSRLEHCNANAQFAWTTKTTGSLWNYYRDEPSDPLSSNSESFKYKASITGNTYNVGNGEDDYDANKVGENIWQREMQKIMIPQQLLHQLD